MAPPRLPAPAFVQAHISHGTSGGHHQTAFPVVTTPAVVHAAAVTSPPPTSPWSQDHHAKSPRWVALCGETVRVVLPAFFDEDLSASCAACAEEIKVIFDTDREVPMEMRVFTLRQSGRATRP